MQSEQKNHIESLSKTNKKRRPKYIGPTNDIYKELQRLKSEFGDRYKPLIKRDIIETKCQNTEKDNKISFSVMQFNVLADGLSCAHTPSNEPFPHSHKECLMFNYRGFRLIEEIVQYKPDVLTCQEIDDIEFFNHYLAPFGYEYVYIPKPSSPCVRIGNTIGMDLPSDGSAVFWNTNVFEKIASYTFGKGVDPNAPKDIRNVVAAMVHLKHKQNKKKQIMVASSHLKAGVSMDADQTRIKQLLYLLPAIKKIMDRCMNENIVLFIGTDFNSPPECVGDFVPLAYQSVVDGKAMKDALDACIESKEHETMDEGQAKRVRGLLKERSYELNYGLGLKSAYCFGEYEGKVFGMDPPFTGTLGGWHCLDFILFEAQKNIQVTHLLVTPKPQKIYCPKWDYPSDHFSVLATFKM